MRLKKTIFDSKSEKSLFYSLESRWAPEFALIPQLPLTKIIEISPKEISSSAYNNLYLKTNLDYTFCQNDEPILSIEFDGIGGGYSRDGKYVPERPTSDQYRKLKMDAKLEYAKNVGYPLIVVSFEEGKPVGAGESLMILDGILGTIIENKERREGLAEVEIEAAERELSTEEIDGLAGDAVIGARMMNPIGKEVEEYWLLCLQQKGFSEVEEYLFDPPCENNCLFVPISPVKNFSEEDIKRSIEAFKTADRVGCRYTANIGNIVSRKEVWIRNFIGLGFFPHLVAEDIAKYIVLKNLCQQLPKK